MGIIRGIRYLRTFLGAAKLQSAPGADNPRYAAVNEYDCTKSKAMLLFGHVEAALQLVARCQQFDAIPHGLLGIQRQKHEHNTTYSTASIR